MAGDVSAHMARALEGPPPQLTYRRALRPGAMLQELWHARELVTVLTERELRVRYKQTKMGFAWALALPLMMMVVFAVFFSEAVEVDTGGVPDPLYFYVGLLPWTFFASSVSIGALSITTNLSLINKVYCPREVFPLAAIGTAGVDGLVASSVLALLFVVYGRIPESTVVWLPALMAVQLAFTVGVTLLLAALVVYLRDLRQVLPMVVQFAMFATPVAYNLDDYLAERWQPVASALNPLVPVIDGYRSTVLLGEPPQGGLLAVAAVSSLVALLGGFLVFKRLETGFADVA
jgi:ABC-type polysaccharide/polyol phosphate export permease